MSSLAKHNPALAWLLLALLAGTTIFAGLGGIPLTDRDEGEYATVAQEMLKTGDWLMPQVNGRSYYEKPAFYFWFVAASFEIFGQNEFAARLPSAIFGLGLLALLVWFAHRHGGETAALLTALFSLTSLLFVLLARVALLDMLLTLGTTATLVFFFEGYSSRPGRGGSFFLLAWACMGLAFFTKGPVGAVIPLFTVFCCTLLNRDLVSAVRRARIPLGILIFLVIGTPWFVAAYLRDGQAFYRGFFVAQNVNRFSDVLLGHGGPLWFYIPVLLLGVWPWSLFALPVGWQSLKSTSGHRFIDTELSLDFFLTIWVMATVLVFTAAATKLPNYILPACPPLILLAARYWERFLKKGRAGGNGKLYKLTVAIGLVLAAFLFVVPALVPVALSQARAGVNPDSFEYAFSDLAPELGVGILLTSGGVLLFCLMALTTGRKSPGRALAALAGAGVIFTFGLFQGTAPPILDYLQTPARLIGAEVRRTVSAGDSFSAYGMYKPTLWFYTGRHIDRIRSGETRALGQYLDQDRRVFLISRLSLLSELADYSKFRLLRREGGYIFGDNMGVTKQ